MKVMKLKDHGYDIYQPTPQLAFGLKDEKVLCVTPLQSFELKIEHTNYESRLDKLRHRIRNNTIGNMTDLIDFCKYKPTSNKRFNYYMGIAVINQPLERIL